MKVMTGRAVVAVIGEVPRRRIDVIGPINLDSGRVEHHEPNGSSTWTALEPKAALIADGDKPRNGVVPRVASFTTEVDAIQRQV